MSRYVQESLLRMHYFALFEMILHLCQNGLETHTHTQRFYYCFTVCRSMYINMHV